MAPPTRIRSALAEQAADHRELVGHLRAAEHHRVRPAGCSRSAAAARPSPPAPGSPAACGSRAGTSQTLACRRCTAPNASPTYSVGQATPARRRTRPAAASSLLVSPGLKRRFSSMTTPPGRSAATAARADGPTVSAGQRHRAAQQLAEAGGDRRQRVRRVGHAAGPAQVRADHDRGVPVEQRVQRRQAGPDLAVVGDPAAIERHVQVGAHQDTPAGHVQVIDRLHRRGLPRSVTALAAISASPPAAWSGCGLLQLRADQDGQVH